MNREEWNLIKTYIDAKIDYEIAVHEEDEDGYRIEVLSEKKVLSKAEEQILEYLKLPIKLHINEKT